MSAARTLTHVDASGKAQMVDVGNKAATERVAVAEGIITMKPETLELVLSGEAKKGDVLAVARLAGLHHGRATLSRRGDGRAPGDRLRPQQARRSGNGVVEESVDAGDRCAAARSRPWFGAAGPPYAWDGHFDRIGRADDAPHQNVAYPQKNVSRN